MDREAFRRLKGQYISGIYLRLFPPVGEATLGSIDVSIGLDFSGDGKEASFLCTSNNDIWTPELMVLPIRDALPWSRFMPMVRDWMEADDSDSYERVLFDTSEAPEFKKMLSQKILSVEVVKLTDYEEPFGIKLSLQDDYIVVYPSYDGTMVETSEFQIGHGVTVFAHLGIVEYVLL